jgi:acyl-CoA synthetase (AMP-forming)/AMP-acid ligase II/3-hydroxymyristoyl/3-hydroxydecanoyl-(acyl carrier protein) dehydratase
MDFSLTFLLEFYLPASIVCAGTSSVSIMVEPLDMLNLLGNSRAPCRTIAWCRGKPVSYEEFVARVQGWQALLNGAEGRAFALYHGDAVEFAAALFGAWHAGKAIYLPGDNLPGTCASLHTRVDGYLGEFDSAWAPTAQNAPDAVNDFGSLDPNFPGLILYTSGTTGAAQAIPKKLAQMAAEVATLEKQFGALLGNSDIISTVSHQHIYGLLFDVLWPLTAGRAIHARTISFLEELTTLERECALVSSPAHLKRLSENPAWLMAAKQLRAIFSSGGPLPFEVAQESKRLLGQVPIEVYGSSETGGIAWRRQTFANEAWKPFPGVDWRIDPDDKVIEVRSPNLPDANWFRTADRAELNADHGFVLGGRIDQIAKIEGKRISLSAIESLLKTSPLVNDARVLMLEGERQRVAAFVVLSDRGRRKLAGAGKLTTDRALRNLLKESIEPAGLPRLWRYLDAFPINAQGKTTYAELVVLLDRKPRRLIAPHQQLIEKTAQHAVFELVAPHDLLYFDGHFPNRPILPGVVQLDWVISYGRECFDLPPVFRAVQGLKFHRVIPPETPFILELDHRPEKSSLTFKIISDLGTHASGRVLFGANHV